MKDPSLPVQRSVVAVLVASSPLSTACGRTGGVEPCVFDRVPRGANGKVTATYPFVHVGEDQVVSDANQCHDASSIYVTVHVYSQAVGKAEAKAIMALVCDILDALLTVAGFQIVTHQVSDGPRHLSDPDGLTSHSVVTFKYQLGPTA